MFQNLIVLELASVLAGPAVGMFFAELGAQVIKVENPATGGDVTRSWKLAAEHRDSDISGYFSALNWGKASLAVDIRTDSGRAIVHDFVRRADIVITSYKPGDDEKLGMDYATLAKINEKIIYGQITGYGPGDPRAGYDAILQAASGFMSINGTPESGPVKMPVALIDVLAAHQLKEGLLLALLQRMQTGKGGQVQVSLLQSGIASLANQATNYLVAGEVPRRSGSEHPNIAPYGSIFTTRDGKQVVMGVGNDVQFAALCDALGVPALARQATYRTNQQRVVNRVALGRKLAEKIGLFSRDTLLEKLAQRKVPAGGILNLSEVFAQPQGAALLLGSLTDIGELRGLRTVAFECSFADTRRALSAPPHLSADAPDILSEFLEYSPERCDSLFAAGTVLLPGGGKREGESDLFY